MSEAAARQAVKRELQLERARERIVRLEAVLKQFLVASEFYSKTDGRYDTSYQEAYANALHCLEEGQ